MNDILFAENLKRLDLLKASRTKENTISVAIYRNHSFELVAGVLNSFLSFSKMNADFKYSDYDDSFNFQFQEADLQIIWVDANRYKTSEVASFLEERVSILRSYTKSPILLVYVSDKELALSPNITDFVCISVNQLLSDMGTALYDYAKEPYSGTSLSDKACLQLARYLGMRYIPAIFKTPFKAVVVDLDNTLYRGILGEDGVDNLVPNNQLQEQLKSLKQQGIMLCIASKNEEDDVKNLFLSRKDFVLNWSDFTTVQINWNSKAENLLKIAKTLNIGTDAMLFLDDNLAEIENVSVTNVASILVADNICQVLKYYPRLLKLSSSQEDNLRSKDIQANAERIELAKKLSPKEYFKKLGIKLEYCINNEYQIPRIAELLGKTNQFILGYKRYKETDVLDFMKNPKSCIITIHMSDNLSDSGIIGIFVAHNEKDELFVDELTVSCRALGRNLENVMLPYLFILAQRKLNTSKNTQILYKTGERNKPALSWLTQLVGYGLQQEGFAQYQIPDDVDLSGLEVNIC